jgi:hypothetical protein
MNSIASIIIIVKKLRGSTAMVYGLVAVACWFLTAPASLLGPVYGIDMITVGIILTLLGLIGWGSFVAMLVKLPVGGPKSSDEPAARPTIEHTVEDHSQGKKPDYVYLLGKIGALAGAVVWVLIAGYQRMSDGDILAAAGWGFVAGAVGGGVGASVGALIDKLRS